MWKDYLSPNIEVDFAQDPLINYVTIVSRAPQNSLQYTGPKIWNSLHPTICCAKNLTQFKNKFRMHIIINDVHPEPIND